MTNRIATLPEAARARGVITLSAGNAGQAYAWAGRTAGVAVTVAMPAGAVRSKVDACLGYGARVVLHGAHVGETLAELERIRDAEGLEFVHPFDDPGGHRRQRVDRPRTARGRPGPRRRRGRGRRRRADLGRRRRAQGAAPGDPRLRRRARALERRQPGDPDRRDRSDPSGERGRRPRRARSRAPGRWP